MSDGFLPSSTTDHLFRVRLAVRFWRREKQRVSTGVQRLAFPDVLSHGVIIKGDLLTRFILDADRLALA